MSLRRMGSGMRTLPELTRIAMSPYSLAACKPDLIRILDARASVLGAKVSTIRRRDGRWMIRVFAGSGKAATVSHVGVGLEATIGVALDLFSDELFSADELYQIQAQSHG